MKYRSVFDIIGPIMIGPSSSHTAGAVRLARVARGVLAATPGRAQITLYGSFAATARGHGTEVALTAGLLGMDPDDPHLREAEKLARETGLRVEWRLADPIETERLGLPPTSARLQLWPAAPAGEGSWGLMPPPVDVLGASIGGGAIEIREVNGFPVSFSATQPTLLVFHVDRPGVVAKVTAELAQAGVNLSQMTLGRKARGREALMVITTDEEITNALIDGLQTLPDVSRVALVKPV
ncbi:MAG: L-serine ammonia-lyase, iron-sulfur-dependent, subunit beta [Limnochordales bacterium]|nr:L-serine ammonia-lyase, iron-sulfur-dependent, subunit beta [Limnochordales bacterium]